MEARAALLETLNAAGAIDWSESVADGTHIRALQGALTGPSPVDRVRCGSKHHLLVDRTRIPLAVTLTGGQPQRRHLRCCRSWTAWARCAAGAAVPASAPSS